MHEGLLDERGFDTQRLPGVPLASKTPRKPSRSPEETQVTAHVNRNTLSPWCWGLDLQKNYIANVSTVGQDKTPSPWGTYDQGGNAVEILDTLAPQPPGYNFLRDWHYYHGGVANAPAYQLEISAFGYNSGDPAIERIYPWYGFRVGVIGTP